MQITMKAAYMIGAATVVAAILMFYFVAITVPTGVAGEVHEHADFRVYLNREPYNFSQEKYMSTDNRTLSNFVHLHDMDGSVIHKHATGITLGFFFRTLGMTFNSTCFAVENASYCSNATSALRFFVNGKENYEFGAYEFNDLDRILISYNAKNITTEINSVTGNACIYSGKCPERGMPGNETSCLTGSGCVVEGAR